MDVYNPFSSNMSDWNDGYRTAIVPYFIDGINPIYQVDTLGTIINIQTNIAIVPHQNDHGYWFASFMTDGKFNKGRVHRKLHRIVLMTFGYIPGCENLQVNHKDYNPDNNRLYNLEWVTPKINVYYRELVKRNKLISGKRNASIFLTPDMVRYIGELVISGMRTDYIIRSMPILDVPTLYNIILGKIHGYVFSPDDIDEMYAKFYHHLSMKQIHSLCKLFEKMRDKGHKERVAIAISELNIPSEFYYSTIAISERSIYKSIVSQYNF